MSKKWPVNLVCDSDFRVNHSHGTDGFTSPPKEGMLWSFSPEKSDSFGRDRSWVPDASMLTTRPPKPLAFSVRLYTRANVVPVDAMKPWDVLLCSFLVLLERNLVW
jgi:hypothetical protein